MSSTVYLQDAHFARLYGNCVQLISVQCRTSYLHPASILPRPGRGNRLLWWHLCHPCRDLQTNRQLLSKVFGLSIPFNIGLLVNTELSSFIESLSTWMFSVLNPDVVPFSFACFFCDKAALTFPFLPMPDITLPAFSKISLPSIFSVGLSVSSSLAFASANRLTNSVRYVSCWMLWSIGKLSLNGLRMQTHSFHNSSSLIRSGTTHSHSFDLFLTVTDNGWSLFNS